MDRGPLQKAILLYLTWLGVIGGALIVMLGDLLPLSLSFVRADSLFTCFLQSQIFFVVFLWPLFLPVLIRGGESGTGLLVQVVVLMVFALPLSLLCANISDVSWGRLISARVASLAARAASCGWTDCCTVAAALAACGALAAVACCSNRTPSSVSSCASS